MLNLLTTVTNFTAYYPFLTSIHHGDHITATLTAFAGCASAVSHLFESHKHQMSGFGMDPQISYALNRIDVIGVILLSIRCAQLLFNKNWWIFLIDHWDLVVLAIPILLMNLISEMDSGHYYYLPLHCVWHLSIFLLLNKYLLAVYA